MNKMFPELKWIEQIPIYNQQKVREFRLLGNYSSLMYQFHGFALAVVAGGIALLQEETSLPSNYSIPTLGVPQNWCGNF